MTPINKESASALRALGENIEKHTRALKTLNEPVEHWDRMLVFIMSRMLDNGTRKEWERDTVSKYAENPNLNDFLEFITSKCRVLEAVNSALKLITSKPSKVISHVVIDEPHTKCGVCSGTHYTYQCNELRKFDVSSRIN